MQLLKVVKMTLYDAITLMINRQSKFVRTNLLA
jgi:hypothetical protein